MASSIVCFGDSIAWGQGLDAGEKYLSLVAEDVRARFAGEAIETCMAAHSGAPLGIGRVATGDLIEGEVPVDDPTVIEQIARLASGVADSRSVALVLMNGGINDITVNYLINPLSDPLEIERLARLHCYDGMLVAVRKCLENFSLAPVVLTSYYPLISEQSDPVLVPVFAATAGLFLASIPGAFVGGSVAAAFQVKIVQNCRVFSDVARDSYFQVARELTAELSAAGDPRRIAVADPNFGPEHAVFAPEARVWSVRFHLDPTEPFLPVDDAIAARVAGCHAARVKVVAA